jgi:hypothetical protein
MAGHTDNKCQQNRGQQCKQQKQQSNQNNENDHSIQSIMMLSNNEVQTEAGNPWLLNSGATCHVTFDCLDLIEFKETSINISAAML